MAETHRFIQNFQDLKNAELSLNEKFEGIKEDFVKHQIETHGRESLDAILMKDVPSDFSVYYCLRESLKQIERALSEKPSAEMTLCKRKLQEAMLWATEAK
jgi:hypothetical protein